MKHDNGTFSIGGVLVIDAEVFEESFSTAFGLWHWHIRDKDGNEWYNVNTLTSQTEALSEMMGILNHEKSLEVLNGTEKLTPDTDPPTATNAGPSAIPVDTGKERQIDEDGQ